MSLYLNAVSQLLKNLCFKGFRFFLEGDIFKGYIAVAVHGFRIHPLYEIHWKGNPPVDYLPGGRLSDPLHQEGH